MILILLTLLNFAHATRVDVRPSEEIKRLLQACDADGDKKITVLDLHNVNSVSTQKSFSLHSISGQNFEVEGTYYLSNLLQELKVAEDAHRGYVDGSRIFEHPYMRISRLIREFYWTNLTRSVDEHDLGQLLEDAKVENPKPRVLYVPENDSQSFTYFTALAKKREDLDFRVEKLLPQVEPAQFGLLSLGLEKVKGKLQGRPFVVPGGRFNEMYGWDSYFEGLGLIHDGRADLAKSMLENQLYEVEYYGQVLNGNRSYYFDRSQPPFLTSYISAVYQTMPRNAESKKWLKHALEVAMHEYQNVWMNARHLTETGLSRYGGTNKVGIPPEVESGHFDFVFAEDAKKYSLPIPELIERYRKGEFRSPQIDEFFSQDRAVRESGHDTTSRWTVDGKDVAADFVTVDLNSLLYKYELDFARLLHEHFHDQIDLPSGLKSNAAEWRARAEKRKALILKYLWNPKDKAFYDYNFKAKKQSTFLSATTFYPFWAYDSSRPQTRILSVAEAKASFKRILSELEAPGGLLSTSKRSWLEAGGEGHPRQWDYPNGWAPHQILAWTALRNYGEEATAAKLAYRWLYMITRNAADYNGTIPEKFDVVKRSHAVFAEYGNVGTSFSYITKEGFGWMNASFQLGLDLLSHEQKLKLDDLLPPEWIESN